MSAEADADGITPRVCVIDDFYALTVPPAKGLRAPLRVCTPAELPLQPRLGSQEEPLALAVEFPVTYEVLSQLKVDLDPATFRKKGHSLRPLRAAAHYLLQHQPNWKQKLTSRDPEGVYAAAEKVKVEDVSQAVKADEGENNILGLSLGHSEQETAIDDEEAPQQQPTDETLMHSEVAHIAGYLQQHDREKALGRRGLKQSSREWLADLGALLSEIGAREIASALIVVLAVEPADLRRLGLTPGEDTISAWFPLAGLLDELEIATLSLLAVVSVMEASTWRQKQQTADTLVLAPVPLVQGDHIFRQMRDTGTLQLLEHHGIYCGNGRIIHFSGNEFSVTTLFGPRAGVKVKETTLGRFLRYGARIRVKQYHKPLGRRETVQRAEEALHEGGFGAYDLFRNNCEHFARWCKTGKARSPQVEKAAIIGGVAAAAASVVAIAAIMMQRK